MKQKFGTATRTACGSLEGRLVCASVRMNPEVFKEALAYAGFKATDVLTVLRDKDGVAAEPHARRVWVKGPNGVEANVPLAFFDLYLGPQFGSAARMPRGELVGKVVVPSKDAKFRGIYPELRTPGSAVYVVVQELDMGEKDPFRLIKATSSFGETVFGRAKLFNVLP